MRRMIVAAALLAACDNALAPLSSGTPGGEQPVLVFLNAAPVGASLEIDNVMMIGNVGAATQEALFAHHLAPGQHQVRIRPVGVTTGGAEFPVTITEGARRTIVAYRPPGAALNARALEDTGAIVPAGKSKVRVINLAPNSNIDIWRTQPDFEQATRFQFPFPFNPVPGPYFQSDAGVWNVWITTTSNSTARLHETGPINIPSGQKRTIVVIDSAGALRLRVLVD